MSSELEETESDDDGTVRFISINRYRGYQKYQHKSNKEADVNQVQFT